MVSNARTLSLVAIAIGLQSSSVMAGCLCDWLWGRRNTSYYVPTATYVPGPTGPTVTSGYWPTPTYAPQYPVTVGYRGVSQVGYAPVTSYSPVTTSYPVAAPTQTSFFGSWWNNQTSYYGSGNYYPSATPYPSTYQSNYAPAENPNLYPPAAIQAPVQAPMGVSPVGFGMNRQTAYRTATYATPVTYYRPVQTVDPRTGLTTTSMQACQSYVNRVQRIPSTTFAPAPAAAGAPAVNCPPGTPCPPGYQAYSNTARPTFSAPVVPQQAYPSLNQTPMVTPSQVPATGDQAPVPQPQIQPTSPVVEPGPATSMRQTPRINVKPIPAPPQYKFQFNTEKERTASTVSGNTIALAGYKTIQWGGKTNAVSSTPKPVAPRTVWSSRPRGQ